MSMADIIVNKLTQALAPQVIRLRNDSDKHIGHAGHDGSGESHFYLFIVSDHFTGMSRIERHRAIYMALGDDVGNQIHALSISAHAPGECDVDQA